MFKTRMPATEIRLGNRRQPGLFARPRKHTYANPFAAFEMPTIVAVGVNGLAINCLLLHARFTTGFVAWYPHCLPISVPDRKLVFGNRLATFAALVADNPRLDLFGVNAVWRLTEQA